MFDLCSCVLGHIHLLPTPPPPPPPLSPPPLVWSTVTQRTAFAPNIFQKAEATPTAAVLQVSLSVACVSAFLSVPKVQLSYSCAGQTVAQNLTLPLVVPKFCTPPDNPVPKEVFFGRWRSLTGQWVAVFPYS